MTHTRARNTDQGQEENHQEKTSNLIALARSRQQHQEHEKRDQGHLVLTRCVNEHKRKR